jgi:hypothetical protein
MPRRPPGLLADEHAVHRCGRLEASGGVDYVTGRHPLALGRPRSEKHQCLARVDSDPDLEVVLLARPVSDRERGTDGALRIVLVRNRRAEQGHDGVPDELLHRPAEALELVAEVLPVRRQQRANVLGVHPLGARREADEVGEEDGDDLALLAPRLGRGGKHAPAAVAEPRIRRVLAPAGSARHHERSLGALGPRD